MTDRIIRPAEAEKLVGYCDVHIRRLEEAGTFPHRFKLNPDGGPYGAAGWLESWIASYNKLIAAGVSAQELRAWVKRLHSKNDSMAEA